VNNVGLNLQVFPDELGWVCAISEDAANTCSRENNKFGLLSPEKRLNFEGFG
jgi:hypothetical protein